MSQETYRAQAKEIGGDLTERFFSILEAEDPMAFSRFVQSIKEACERGESVCIQIDLTDFAVNDAMERNNWVTLDALYDHVGSERNFSIEIITSEQPRGLISRVSGKRFKGFGSRAVSIKSKAGENE